MIPLFALLLAHHEPPREPPPLAKLPDDADPACAGGCHLFGAGPGYCAGGCRLAAKTRGSPPLSAEALGRYEAHVREQAEAKARKDHAAAEIAMATRLTTIPAKTARRRAKKAAQAAKEKQRE